MQMKLLVLVSMMTVTTMLMVGCHHGPTAATAYGRTWNPDRVKRGIPIIPPTWVERDGLSQADWNNPDHADAKTTSNPMHSGKEVFVDRSGNPVRETDFYQSGKWYPGLHPDPDDPNTKKREILTITYDFEAARAGKNPWYCEVNSGPHARSPSGEVTLDEAESMLKEWGLRRLD